MASKKLLSTDELAKSLKGMDKKVKLDVIQMLVDLVGIVDPTGTADGVSAFISLVRGDLLGAGISLISMLPFGDLAKAAKLPKYAKSVEKMIRYARRRPALSGMMRKTCRQLEDILLQAKRIADKAGAAGHDVARQIDKIREPIRRYIKRVTDIERLGAAKVARSNGKTVAGAFTDITIRGSKVTHNKVVDILEAGAKRSTEARKGIEDLLERMALADKWELKAHIHRSNKSVGNLKPDRNLHFNIELPDERQIHVLVDAKGNFVRASTLTRGGGERIYLTPKKGTQAN